MTFLSTSDAKPFLIVVAVGLLCGCSRPHVTNNDATDQAALKPPRETETVKTIVDPGYIVHDGAPPFGSIERTQPSFGPTDVGVPAYPGTQTIERGFKYSDENKTSYLFQCRTADAPDAVVRKYKHALPNARTERTGTGIMLSNRMADGRTIRIGVSASVGRSGSLIVIRVGPTQNVTRSSQ